MKILQVTHSYYPAVRYGGPIRSVAHLCSGLQNLGHEVEVCTTGSDSFGPVDVPLDEVTLVNNIPVHYFHCPGWHYAGYSPAMEKWLKQNIHNYDIVHIQGVWTFPQRYAARACRKNKIPYIISPRGMADQRIAQKRFTLSKWLYINIYDRSNLRKAAYMHYTAPGELQNSLFKTLPPKNCIVPNPVIPLDTTQSDQHKVEAPKSDYILIVGRIAWTKNIELLIQSLKLFDEQFANISLYIVGPDTENLQNALQRLALKEGVADRVKFLGTISGTELKTLYRGALLLASPALSESFGNTIAEALMEETPVVATKASGISTFENLAQCMRLCVPDVNSVYQAIMDVINNRSHWQSKALQAQDILANEFNTKTVAKRMSEFYEEVMAAQGFQAEPSHRPSL